jgi:metal-responsive CopG/Arc/MetJ family transcriptional regulator
MKERITITIDENLLKWIDKNIESKVFANRSHAVEYLIMQKLIGEKK